MLQLLHLHLGDCSSLLFPLGTVQCILQLLRPSCHVHYPLRLLCVPLLLFLHELISLLLHLPEAPVH